MSTTSPKRTQPCEPFSVETFTFTEPYIIASDTDGYSVLIPGGGNPLDMITRAIETMRDYGLDVNQNDPDLDAEVRSNQHVRFYRCENADHAFHPEFGVPAHITGATAVTSVTFTSRTH